MVIVNRTSNEFSTNDYTFHSQLYRDRSEVAQAGFKVRIG